MITTVYLVRHGSHDQLGRILSGRGNGVRLSAAGLDEAHAVGRTLAGRGVAALYASPQVRCGETAAAMGEALGLAPLAEPALDEIDFGEWAGRAFDDLAADPRWAAWNTRRGGERAPGGETMAEAAARVLGFMEAAHLRHRGQAVAAVSHSDVIKATVLSILGASHDAYARLDVDPASITTVLVDDAGKRLQRLNEGCA